MIGVSPAFFISRFGDRFTPSQYRKGIKMLKELGFDSFQLEIYHQDSIDLWTSGGFQSVLDCAVAEGLTASQCVGHVLLNAFVDEQTLFSSWGVNEAATIAAALPLELCSLLTIPIPTFKAGEAYCANDWRRIDRRFAEKAKSMVDAAGSHGVSVALEVLPGSLAGGTAGFLRLAEQLEAAGTGPVGFNLDTGHAWACKENLELSICRLGSRISGTHLCDNRGLENLSLAPGTGSIDWPAVITTLASTGYTGSLDIEIHCQPDAVPSDYGVAREYIADLAGRSPAKEAI